MAEKSQKFVVFSLDATILLWTAMTAANHRYLESCKMPISVSPSTAANDTKTCNLPMSRDLTSRLFAMHQSDSVFRQSRCECD